MAKVARKLLQKAQVAKTVAEQLVAEEALRTTARDATTYVVYKLHLNIKIKYCYNSSYEIHFHETQYGKSGLTLDL